MIIRLLIVALSALILLVPQQEILAAKKRVSKAGSTRTRSATGYSSARLSRATNSIVVTFRNLANVGRVTYELSYSARGIPQGVIGIIAPSGQTSDSRDLYFGTCSKGVCTPHYGIANAVLLVTAQLSSGATNTKRYRIKV